MSKIVKAYISAKNILHYSIKSKNGIVHKTFNVSNEFVKKQAIQASGGIGWTENGIHLREYLPVEVCKALLETGEYKWTRGDRFNNYFADVYHKCWEVNKNAPNYEKIERCGNVASNPCYGWIRYKLESKGYTEPVRCPRCEAVYAIYNSYKPLKWKLWDTVLRAKEFIECEIIHNIYKDAETFFFTKSKNGKEILKGWQEAIEKGEVGELIYWRKHYLKTLLKGSNLTYKKDEKEWIIYNPELYDETMIKEIVKKQSYKVIWEHKEIKKCQTIV